MGYGSRGYGRGYSRGSRNVTVGRVSRPNRRPGACRTCGEEIPAGAGQLYRESDGAWSVVHTEASQGGWLMNPQPYTGGCPESTDKRNAELHANGFLGPDAPAPVSERDRIARAAETWAASNPVEEPRPRRATYAYTSGGARMTSRCTHEDYPCCGC